MQLKMIEEDCKWDYRNCDNCKKQNAFEIVDTNKEIIYQCAWCDWEFKK